MNEILRQNIKQAEDDFSFCCNVNHTKNYTDIEKHIDAIVTLFTYALHLKLKVKELISILENLPKEYELYKTLIGSYKNLVDDENMVARKYGAIYLKYLGERNKGREDEDEIIREIIFKCEDIK